MEADTLTNNIPTQEEMSMLHQEVEGLKQQLREKNLELDHLGPIKTFLSKNAQARAFLEEKVENSWKTESIQLHCRTKNMSVRKP